MSVDALTGIVLICALVMVLASERVMLTVFVVMTLFQSAAAIKVGSFGVMPGHLLLSIVAYRCLKDPARRASVIRMLSFPHAGFWLVGLCFYSAFSGYIYPRMMAGMTFTNPIGTTNYEPSFSVVPLGPSSGNLTQTIYMAGSTLTYVVIAAQTSTVEGLKDFKSAFLLFAVVDILLGIVDLAGWGDLLSIVHNGNYELHLDEMESGLKRIAGAFSEASAFATATLGTLGFATRLCLGNVDARFTIALALAKILLLILSTSSTAYGGLCVLLLCLYLWACGRSLAGPLSPNTVVAAVGMPVLAAVAAALILLSHGAQDAIMGLLDDIVFNKSTSDSGLGRAALNQQGMANFFDTMGLGAGAGSARTSSFPIAVLANLGLPGAIAYLMFLGQVFFRPSEHRPNSAAWHIRGACRWGALGMLIAQVFSGTLVDLGILFFMLAGAGSARPPAPVAGRAVPIPLVRDAA